MRILVSSVLLAAGLAAAAPATKDSKPVPATVRVLDIVIAGPAKGKVTEPAVLTAANDPPKYLPTADLAKEVTKAVDFNKEQVVYFQWSGSGGDKITHAVGEGDKASEVTFTVTRGLTRDLRQHHKLFVLPRNSTFKVVTAK